MSKDSGRTDKELKELMDQRIEEKKQEWMDEKKEELKKEAKEEARKEIRQEIMNTRKDTNNKEKVSRRQFLKKLGAGAIGLGALSLSPAASQLKLTKNGISKDGNQAFLGLSGSSSLGSDLDLSGYSITDSTQGYLDLTGDGNDLRLATGQAIEDGSGVGRVELRSNLTGLKDQNGKFFIQGRSTGTNSQVQVHAFNGAPFQIYDEEGQFDALTYTTSASAPGTLELTNTTLDAQRAIEFNGGRASINGAEHPLNDGEKAQILPDYGTPFGLFVVTHNNGGTALFVNDAYTIIELHDPRGEYTTTEGNGGTTNIYYDSNNTRFEIENQTGGSLTYRVVTIGTSI